MKKIILIAISCFLFIIAALAILYSETVFQRGNPLPYVVKMFTLNDSNPYSKVFADEDIYLTRIDNSEILIKHIETTYDINFAEQMGSAYLFKSEDKSIIASTEIYWRKYLVWELTINSNTSDFIAFDYFYRGFTPITEESDSEAFFSVLGARIILTEEDWRDFTQKFCPTAGSLSIPDFSYECLIADGSMYGSRASENSSTNILKITVENNFIVITYDEESTSDKIYAINKEGVGHWFVNVVKVNKNDLPFNVEGVYSAGNYLAATEM